MSPASQTSARRVCVYRATGPTDGHIVRDLLVSDGIPVEMRGDALTSLRGAIPIPDAWPTLWVMPHNARRATDLIAAFDAPPKADQAPWACPCGETNDPNFASCWSCGEDRPDLDQALDG